MATRAFLDRISTRISVNYPALSNCTIHPTKGLRSPDCVLTTSSHMSTSDSSRANSDSSLEGLDAAAWQEREEKLKKKIDKLQLKLTQTQQKLERSEARLMRVEDKWDASEMELREKLHSAHRKLDEKLKKEGKVKHLVDTVKLSVQQGRLEMSAKRMSRATIMKERLVRLANTLEDIFGGMVFIAPLDVGENQALVSESNKKSGKKFLAYIWSHTGKEVFKQSGMDLNTPMLERSPIFQYVLDSREIYFPDLKLLTLPKNHPKMTSALLVPVVVDGKTLALTGFGNGTYTKEDASVLFESLPSAWMSVISEAVKESSSQLSLLTNTLPKSIVERLMNASSSATNRSSSSVTDFQIADSFPSASILFCDIVGFTRMSSSMKPEQLVGFLSNFFSLVDDLVDDHGLEKIKTIGDAYMVGGGFPEPNRDHAESVADFAFDLLECLENFNAEYDTNIQVRVGIHSGPVVAGVIGKRKYTYDVWGDTVNKASRMESTSLPNRVHISEDTYNILKHYPRYVFEPRGMVKIHNVGEMNTFFLSKNEGSSTKEVTIKTPHRAPVPPLSLGAPDAAGSPPVGSLPPQDQAYKRKSSSPPQYQPMPASPQAPAPTKLPFIRMKSKTQL